MNKIVKLIIAVLIIPFITIVCCTATSHAATWLSVSYIQQENTLWCWAACAQIAGKYYNSSSTVSQTQIVIHVKGSNVNETGTISDEVDAATFATNYNTSFVGKYNAYSFSALKGFINSGWIVIPMVYKASTNSGHFYVIYGYNETSSGSYLYLVDPATGTGKYTSYSSFLNGTWTDSRPWTSTVY